MKIMVKPILAIIVLALAVALVTFAYTSYTQKSLTGYTVAPNFTNFIFIAIFGIMFAVFFGLMIFYGLFRPV